MSGSIDTGENSRMGLLRVDNHLQIGALKQLAAGGVRFL